MSQVCKFSNVYIFLVFKNINDVYLILLKHVYTWLQSILKLKYYNWLRKQFFYQANFEGSLIIELGLYDDQKYYLICDDDSDGSIAETAS